MAIFDCASNELRDELPEELPVIPTAASLRTILLKRVADRRWRATQMFMYDGVYTQADAAMSAVTAAVVSSQFLLPDHVRTWKLGDGEFRSWTIYDIIQFGMAISAHIQICFDIESEKSTQIAATDLEVLLDYDIEQGWP